MMMMQSAIDGALLSALLVTQVMHVTTVMPHDGESVCQVLVMMAVGEKDGDEDVGTCRSVI